MRRIMLTLLLAAILSSAALAQGKITTDPNTGGPKPPAVEESGDKRLAQKVTYEAKKKMVSEILADLSKQTGVTFFAGANNVDWQVRDRRMNVFAKDVPLARLMSSLARVMHFKWSKSGKDAAPNYRLFADQRTIRESEAKREKEENDRKQRQAERRKKALEAYGNTANMSPVELAKLKSENPLLYFCASEGITGSIASFAREVPGASDALINGQKLTLSGADLSPAAQQAMLAAMTGVNRLEKQFGGSHARELPGSLAGNLGRVTIDINKHLDMVSSGPGSGFMLGMIGLRYSDGVEGGESTNQTMPIFDPNSAMAKLIGKALLQTAESGRPMEDIGKEIEPQLGAALAEDIKKEMPTSVEPAPERTPDPDLEKKIKMDATDRSLENVLGALSKASEFAVVSDSFGRSHALPGVMVSEGDLKTVADKLGTAYICDWERHGPVIEFRDKDWLRKRAAQIPEAWLDYWRSKYKADKKLDILELAKMAALTSEQLQVNILSDEVLQNCYFTVVSSRDILKLYACLSDEQRQVIFTESGLDLRSLGPNQWPMAESAIQSQNASLLQNADTALMLVGHRRTSGTAIHYSFSLNVEGAGNAGWSVAAAAYVEKPQPVVKPDPAPKADKPAQKAEDPAKKTENGK